MILSFDVWNTLLTANPEFKKARIDTFSEMLGVDSKNVSDKLQSTKKTLDFIQENKGVAFDSLFCWELFVDHMRITGDTSVLAEMLLEESNELFKEYPPKFDVELIKQIRKAKKRADVNGLILISNTNFVPGSVLWSTCFEHLDLFDDAHFSDILGFAKPSPEIFKSAWFRANQRVHHFGDTIKTDGAAAKHGANFIHVENPQTTLEIVTRLNEGFNLSQSIKA